MEKPTDRNYDTTHLLRKFRKHVSKIGNILGSLQITHQQRLVIGEHLYELRGLEYAIEVLASGIDTSKYNDAHMIRITDERYAEFKELEAQKQKIMNSTDWFEKYRRANGIIQNQQKTIETMMKLC